MAHFPIPAEPTLNINSVNEVLETDPVIAAFINGYFQQFLENDQALKNMIDKKPDKVTLPAVATSGSYNDLTDKPTIPSGAAADYNVANNDTTTAAGFLADARIVKTHGDEIDGLTEKAFLQKYELFTGTTTIAENNSGGKTITDTTDDAVITTVIIEDSVSGMKTITKTVVPNEGNYKYVHTTTITKNTSGTTIKQKCVKEAK